MANPIVRRQPNLDLVTATSTLKTPAATNQYQAHTNNSMLIPAGTWELTHSVVISSSGGDPSWSGAGAGFYAANGADNGAVPALLTTLPGVTLLTPYPESQEVGLNSYVEPGSTTSGVISGIPIIIRVTTPVLIYVNTYSSMTTAANARVRVNGVAKRLKGA